MQTPTPHTDTSDHVSPRSPSLDPREVSSPGRFRLGRAGCSPQEEAPDWLLLALGAVALPSLGCRRCLEFPGLSRASALSQKFVVFFNSFRPAGAGATRAAAASGAEGAATSATSA
eukprot:scaffold128155_cov60-Phaeocystis_antarctica.AAC.4